MILGEVWCLGCELIVIGYWYLGWLECLFDFLVGDWVICEVLCLVLVEVCEEDV